ncbi:MAG: CotH kinase family protein [Deltaproteobacteria bacterium]|nr:CotH kinase family protein [Deltaproteobacteria bacterium]
MSYIFNTIRFSLILFTLASVFACGEKDSKPSQAGNNVETDSPVDSDTHSLDSSPPTPTDSFGLVFSPPSGTFTGTREVTISPRAGIDGVIRYTVNGAAPNENSPVYETPIVLSASSKVQAAIFQNGETIAEGSGFYVATTGNIRSDIPIVVLDNMGKGKPGSDDMPTMFLAFDTVNGIADISVPAHVGSHAAFHLRGQSTRMFPKSPYRVELRDQREEDMDWPVLGLPSESDWVMRGPYVDKSLIRDAFHYDLGRDIGMASPRYRFCELYTNLDGGVLDESDYQGVYMIVENIKNSKNRLNLKQLHPTDTDADVITGGYIFKFEWDASEPPVLNCPGQEYCWTEMEIVDPKDITPQQATLLAYKLYEFSYALHTSSLETPDGGYGQYIDVISFADQIIMNEIGREADSYLRSAWFYMDRNGPIVAGPLWDYNLSLGTGFDFNGIENLDTAGWMYEENNKRDAPSNDWFYTLMQDPEFKAVLAERWRVLRQGQLSNDALSARITQLAAPLKNAAYHNFQKWDNLQTPTVFMVFVSPVSQTWEEQIEILRNWLLTRVAWIDTQWL